ncbi:MAG: hotdog domain-containing protein [Anaerotignum sp.]
MNPLHESPTPQTTMENLIKNQMQPGSETLTSGVIAKMNPRFVACDYKEKTLELAFDVLDWEQDTNSAINHGILGAAFDSTLGLLCRCYVYPHVITTVSLNTSYYSPVFFGDTFYIKAKIEFQGRSLCNLVAEATLDNQSIHSSADLSMFASTSAVFKIFKTTA